MAVQMAVVIADKIIIFVMKLYKSKPHHPVYVNVHCFRSMLRDKEREQRIEPMSPYSPDADMIVKELEDFLFGEI